MDGLRGGGVSVVGGAGEGLPVGLASMAPGPGLAAVLAAIDRSRVAAEELRDLVRARARQVAFDQAELLADVYDAGRAVLAGPGSLDRDGPAPGKFAADVVSWMLYVTPSYAQVQVDLARALIERLPAVYAALRAGNLDVAKAAAFVDALSGIADDEVARAVAGRLLDRARAWNLAQLRERLRYHVDRADRCAARRRYQTGVAGRGVSLRAEDDGTAALSGWGLPPARAAAAFERLDRLARAARSGGDARTLGQLRADACLDLLIGNPFQLQPSLDPLTAAADAAYPPEQDGWDQPEPAPAAWFAAQRVDEQPDWWRRARRRHTPITADECAARARARTDATPTGDGDGDGDGGGGGEHGSRFGNGKHRDLDRGLVPDPPWWQHASATRPPTAEVFPGSQPGTRPPRGRPGRR